MKYSIYVTSLLWLLLLLLPSMLLTTITTNYLNIYHSTWCLFIYFCIFDYNNRRRRRLNQIVPNPRKPRTADYTCSICNESYQLIVTDNPWWAVYTHECPACRKIQIPRIDINNVNNAIELDPNIVALYGEGNCNVLLLLYYCAVLLFMIIYFEIFFFVKMLMIIHDCHYHYHHHDYHLRIITYHVFIIL